MPGRFPSPGLAAFVLATSLATVLVAAGVALGVVPGLGNGGPANGRAFAVSASRAMDRHPTRAAPTHVVVVPPAPNTDTISAPLPPLPQAPAPPVAAAVSAPATNDLIWPIHGPVTQEFGHNGHPGIDIAGQDGAAIHAAGNGVVIWAGWQGGYGNFVLIDHHNGIITGYGHQSRVAVTRGQTVNQGDVIGYEGSTGDSTGPHVHFEVRVDNTPRNPRIFITGNP